MGKAHPPPRLEVDQETGQTVLKGMGELHLEVTIDRMRTELGVEANMGKPRVSFREAFGTPIERVYTHKKQTGGSGQYAEIKMIFEPTAAGTGIEFSDEVVGGRVPREFIPSVEYAIRSEAKRGQVAELTETATKLSERLVVLLRRKLLLPTMKRLMEDEAHDNQDGNVGAGGSRRRVRRKRRRK